MSGKKLRALVCAAAMCAASTPVFAVMSVPDGWYIEANGGSTYLYDKTYPGNSSSSGLGGNANVGYKFMPYFATEIGYTLYAATSINAPTGTKAGTDKHYSYDLAAKGILPIYISGLELFAKLGIERLNSSVSIQNQNAANSIGLGSGQHSAISYYLGGGVQYYFTPEFAANVQWARAHGTHNGTGTMDLLSLGVSFIVD